jgi:hypothetical protein
MLYAMTRPRTTPCIDDHRHALLGRKMLQEKTGYEVLKATSSDEALKTDNPSRSFFLRWLNHWKDRNQAVKS